MTDLAYCNPGIVTTGQRPKVRRRVHLKFQWRGSPPLKPKRGGKISKKNKTNESKIKKSGKIKSKIKNQKLDQNQKVFEGVAPITAFFFPCSPLNFQASSATNYNYYKVYSKYWNWSFSCLLQRTLTVFFLFFFVFVFFYRFLFKTLNVAKYISKFVNTFHCFSSEHCSGGGRWTNLYTLYG